MRANKFVILYIGAAVRGFRSKRKPIMRKLLLIVVCLAGIVHAKAQDGDLVPLTERVNIQRDSARLHQIVDGRWVAVGSKKAYAVQKDCSLPFDGVPSYRFELKGGDNTLAGYSEGSRKGRAELSYCYATSDDFKEHPAGAFAAARQTKSVYHYGKGSCSQGASMRYAFSINVPHTLDRNVSVIFAQWHGMPDRTLVSDPEGRVSLLTPEEFLELCRRMTFEKGKGYFKMAASAKGSGKRKAGQPSGWSVEQGGYPPLAFGFSNGYFYIKANSDRRRMTDKGDRCNSNPEKDEVMRPVVSRYKASTIVFKMPFEDFPKDCWVTFLIDIDWTVYGKEKEDILKPGCLSVEMDYDRGGEKVRTRIVDNQELLVGRNDEAGYYFKFGIYRFNDIPVCYNLAGYKEMERNK